MKYKTAAGFRQALETHLRECSLQKNLPLLRLRKLVAFDRFLARLARGTPNLWMVKGGFAVQLRLGDQARTTRDIDAAATQAMRQSDALEQLRRAATVDLEDWFEFRVGEPSEVATGAPHGGWRFPITCLLDGREFEQFHLDVGCGDPVPPRIDKIACPSLLAFAGVAPTKVPCYPPESQIAEKFHAYTRSYSGGASSRVRDLVDILLIASMCRLDGGQLSKSLRAVFDARGTHKLPAGFPRPPRNWSGTYRKMARELHLESTTLAEAAEAAIRFLNPVLQNHVAKWNCKGWAWSKRLTRK